MKPRLKPHAFDDATLVCSHCGATAELLQWANGNVKCSLADVALKKRDRYFYDLGRSSRDDEIEDLGLKIICLESILLRSQQIATETVT